MSQVGLGELLLIILVGICVLKPTQIRTLALICGRLCSLFGHQVKKIQKELSGPFDPSIK